MKRILVTGGAGFLGSHLCERLLERGDRIICVDNLYTGQHENIAHLHANSRFNFVEHDISIPLNIDADEIYNLACPASPIHYQRNPVETIRTCVLGSLNMLNLAQKNNAKILQASTSEVYGDPEIHPQPESYWGHVNPIGIRSCYDEGKRCAETLFFDYHRQYDLKIKVVRIFNTYGPRMQLNDGRVISNFIVQCLSGEDITLYGDGLQTRSFCYVDDLIEAMIRMMDTPDDVIGPINIGSSYEFTIKDLAEKILKKTNSATQIQYCSLPKDDPRQRRPNLDQAQKILSWNATTDIDSGLQKTINFFSDKLLSKIHNKIPLSG